MIRQIVLAAVVACLLTIVAVAEVALVSMELRSWNHGHWILAVGVEEVWG